MLDYYSVDAIPDACSVYTLDVRRKGSCETCLQK